MEHLNQCPEGKSPNKDYLLGLYKGIDEAYLYIKDSDAPEYDFDLDDMIAKAKEEFESEESQ